jgi:stage II sporulation protein D
VNVVDLEAYLRGVVPAEVPAEWPAAALEAQAIAARTYTVANLDPAAPYDICATLLCQVYEGVAAEDPRTDAAVRATEGLVVRAGGEVARTYYHADSGGRTASAAEVWGYDRSYLRTREDVAVASPHRGWTATLAPARLAAALAAEGRDVGTPTRLRIVETSASGRASRAVIEGTAGAATLAGPRLTRVLRGAGLKSTRVTSTGPLSVRGDGWGHGVGLSQYGAMGLARQGRTAEQILRFYYPGTRVAALPRDPVLAAR